MNILRKNGSTSNILRTKLRRSDTGQGLTGLSSSSSGLIISTICDNEASATNYTQSGSTIETITTLGTFATPTSTKCRFKEVDATNQPGLYEVQLADARFAVSGSKTLRICLSGATTLLEKEILVQLTAVDFDDAVRGGQTALPNAAAGANGGLPLSVDSSGRVDVLKINGTSQTARDIGASVLLSSGTGTGQLDFTSGVVKANAVQLLGTAWLTPGTAGTPDVNAKLLGGTAQTGRDVGLSVLLSSGTGTGQISLSSGAVTVGTNNDKTGYTASTVSDKTGYSLTQAFPTNFSSLAITAGGAVTAGTVSDKTGYALTQGFPSNFASLSIDVSGKVLLQATQTGVTIPTVTTLTSAVALTSAYDAAKTAATQTSVNAIPTNPLTSLGATAPEGWINADALAASALDGKGDWSTDTDMATALAWLNDQRGTIIDELSLVNIGGAVDVILTAQHGTGPWTGGAIADPPSASDIATAVWTNDERTLTDIDLSGIDLSGLELSALTEEQAAQLTAIQAKTDLISTGEITITSPVADGGETISLVRGDDYLAADSRALLFENLPGPSLIGGTVELKVGSALDASGTVLSAHAVQVELTRTQTALLTATETSHQLQATLANGSKELLLTGKTTITGRL